MISLQDFTRIHTAGYRDFPRGYHCPWAEIGKSCLPLEPIRLQDSLLCPLEKKIYVYCMQIQKHQLRVNKILLTELQG